MRQFIVLFFVFIIVTPVYSAYKIYLKNGSVIEGVSSYTEDNGSMTIYFKTGSMTLEKNSLLKIEGYGEEPVKESVEESGVSERHMEDEGKVNRGITVSDIDKKDELDKIRSEIEALNSEIKVTEEREIELVNQINEKMGRRYMYNVYQLRRLESEIEPLRQELYTVQKKKQELVQKRNSLADMLKGQQ